MPAERSRTHIKDVAVVGGGLAGSLAAIELAKRGHDVVLFERKRDGSLGAERSEAIFPETVKALGIEPAIQTPLTNFVFISLDSNRQFSYQVDEPPLIAIDHRKTLALLHEQLGRYPSADIRSDAHVFSIQPDQGHVDVRENRSFERFSHVVDASGPRSGIDFVNRERQRQYDDSVVAIAYGKTCEGQINLPHGENTAIVVPSVSGTGKLSWVKAAGEGRIEIVYADYTGRRRDALGSRAANYRKLREVLEQRGLIKVGAEIETIAGVIGLESTRFTDDPSRIFHHGERGQYSSGTTGDTIATTVQATPKLGEIIDNNGSAYDYFKYLQTLQNARMERALMMTRVNSNTVGEGIAILESIKKLPKEEQAEFARTHKIPLKHLPITILTHPHLIFFIRDLAREYAKDAIKGRNSTSLS